MKKFKPRNCWKCGASFIPASSGQRYCDSPECREFATSDEFYLERAHLRMQYMRNSKVCQHCGCRFEITDEHTDDKFCSDRCRKARVPFRAPFSSETIYNRKCHDCGTPTNDYRCPACRTKWKQKNNVALETSSDDITI